MKNWHKRVMALALVGISGVLVAIAVLWPDLADLEAPAVRIPSALRAPADIVKLPVPEVPSTRTAKSEPGDAIEFAASNAEERVIRIVFADSTGQRLKLGVRHVMLDPFIFTGAVSRGLTLEDLLENSPVEFVDEIMVTAGQRVHFVFGFDDPQYKVTANYHMFVSPRLRRSNIGLLNLNRVPRHEEEHVVPVLTEHQLAVVVQYDDGQPFRFLAVSCGFGWGELLGEVVEYLSQRRADQVDHGLERVRAPVASGSGPGRLEQAVKSFQPRVAVG